MSYQPRITLGLPSAPMPTCAPPLSAQLCDAGRLLLDRSVRGEFVALDECDQADLRGLARQMIGWADRVETMERAQPAPRRKGRLLGRLRHWWRRVARS